MDIAKLYQKEILSCFLSKANHYLRPFRSRLFLVLSNKKSVISRIRFSNLRSAYRMDENLAGFGNQRESRLFGPVDSDRRNAQSNMVCQTHFWGNSSNKKWDVTKHKK